jgi:hypothetical protein
VQQELLVVRFHFRKQPTQFREETASSPVLPNSSVKLSHTERSTFGRSFGADALWLTK